MLTTTEIKAVRDDLQRACDIVAEAFSTTRAAGISTIARDLRHIRNSINDAIADLAEMQAELEKQTPSKCGGGDA